MSAAAAVTAADRLGLTLFLAAAVHGLVILGVGFSPYERSNEVPRALDVVLVQQETDSAPDEADYLANVDAAGGGNSDERARPRAPVSSPEREARAGLAPAPLEAGAPEPDITTPEPVLTSRDADASVPEERRRREVNTEKPRRQPEEIEYEARVAKLASEIDNALVNYAQRPRKMFVTARTRASVAAEYMHDWVETVERIGNTNYPREARRRGLSGALVLVVAVRADGSLRDVHVRASSGQPILDRAAEEIVRLAAPFRDFPDELREETDLLYITRTWEFTAGARLETR